jgi:hypothetical protein
MKDYTPKPGTKLCVTITNGHKSYLPISDSFPAASCKRFADSMEAETYEFRCVAKDGETFVGDESHKPTQGNCKWE